MHADPPDGRGPPRKALAAPLLEQMRIAEPVDGRGPAFTAAGIVERALASLGGRKGGVEQRGGSVRGPVLPSGGRGIQAEQHTNGNAP